MSVLNIFGGIGVGVACGGVLVRFSVVVTTPCEYARYQELYFYLSRHLLTPLPAVRYALSKLCAFKLPESLRNNTPSSWT